MKKKLSIICCFLIVFCGFAQDKEIDSLKNVIKTVDSLELKAAAHGRIAWLNLASNVEVARAHLDSSHAILLKRGYTKGVAQNNYRYAVLFRITGKYDKALQYVEKSYQYNLSQKDSFKIANDLFQRGVIYSLKGDYDKSIKAYYNILDIYEKLGKKKGIGMTLNSIGIVYKNLEDYPKAISVYKKAISTLENSTYEIDLANVYGNLGAVYLLEKKRDSSLVYYQKAREIDIKQENDWGLSINSQNIGSLYIELGNYTAAIEYLNEAYNIQIKNNYNSALAETRVVLGKAYLKQRNYNKSEAILLEGLFNAPKSKKILRDYQFFLHKLYKEKGNYKKALIYYEEYFKYNDSILNKENLKHINELDAKYQTGKKDKEIIQQQLQLEKKDKELQKNKTQFSYMVGGALLLLITSILLWFLYQQRQKRKNQEILTLKREHQVQTLESLIKGEEKERLRIAKELHDGVNGDLSAIKFKLSSLLEMNNTVIKEAVSMIDKSCHQVRAISHNLVPPSLQDFNLIEALEEYCANMNAIHSPKISFQHLGEEIVLNKEQETNIFRIVQELINNSIKHAEADEVNVQISSRKNTIQLTVEDNGKGYDGETIKMDGIGLKNIQSRVDYLNATLDLVSNAQGTSTTIEIDIDKVNEN